MLPATKIPQIPWPDLYSQACWPAKDEVPSLRLRKWFELRCALRTTGTKGDTSGKNADYIPFLAKVPSNRVRAHWTSL